MIVNIDTSELDCREKAGTSVAGNNIEMPADSYDGDHGPQTQSKVGFSDFAALDVEDGPAEDEDFGGLMVRVHRFPCFSTNSFTSLS